MFLNFSDRFSRFRADFVFGVVFSLRDPFLRMAQGFRLKRWPGVLIGCMASGSRAWERPVQRHPWEAPGYGDGHDVEEGAAPSEQADAVQQFLDTLLHQYFIGAMSARALCELCYWGGLGGSGTNSCHVRASAWDTVKARPEALEHSLGLPC